MVVPPNEGAGRVATAGACALPNELCTPNDDGAGLPKDGNDAAVLIGALLLESAGKVKEIGAGALLFAEPLAPVAFNSKLDVAVVVALSAGAEPNWKGALDPVGLEFAIGNKVETADLG